MGEVRVYMYALYAGVRVHVRTSGSMLMIIYTDAGTVEHPSPYLLPLKPYTESDIIQGR